MKRLLLCIFIAAGTGCFDNPTVQTNPDAGNDADVGENDLSLNIDSGADGDPTTRTIVSIHAGYRTTCALFDDGYVGCWGADAFGLIDVPDSVHGADKLSMHRGTACALKEGDLQCWGSDTDGLLQPPTGGVTDVVVGSHHACVLKGDVMSCWGADDLGQLQVPLDVPFDKMAVGDQFTCAANESQVYCWGRNTSGEVSLPETPSAPAQLAFETGDGIDAIAAGSRIACAVTDGALFCWGSSANGKIPGQMRNVSPTRIALPEPVVDVVISNQTICAHLESRRVHCWGANRHGQAGTLRGGVVSPEWLGFESGQKLHAGVSSICVMSDPGPACWGSNNYGETSPSFTHSMTRPRSIEGLRDVENLVFGRFHGCHATDGAVYCWGANDELQTSAESDDGKISFGLAAPFGAERLWAGPQHMCAVSGTETSCWGANNTSQSGKPASLGGIFPSVLLNTPAFDEMSLGVRHTCGIWNNELWCWGSNNNGQLGMLAGGSVDVPQMISDDFNEIAVSDFTTCGIRSDGLYCVGGNESGEIPNSNEASRAQFPATPDIAGATGLCMGRLHGCAIFDSAVHCWGDNSYGQLATTAELDGVSRVNLRGTVLEVACGDLHNCATTTEGIYCWGDNRFGQVSVDLANEALQNPDETNVIEPHLIDTPVGALLLSSRHSCVQADGDVICWGESAFNQFADGTIASLTPEPIKLDEIPIRLFEPLP